MCSKIVDMECPKCGKNIDDKMLVCPNCKKVLKLKCPICGAIGSTNTCQECGYIIISKCHQCGKINPTIQGKCSKCGFDTNVSAILHESNIEEFACATIDFPNMEDMKAVLGSRHLYEKFRQKIHSMIYDYSKSKGLKRGVFGSTYVIRFNKDYTYSASANNALRTSIELMNMITAMNSKLAKAKDAQLKCNIAIIKRDVYSFNDDYKSGININLIYKNITKDNLLKNLQLLVDGSIFEVAGKSYPMESVGMTRAKNKDLLFWEVDLTNYIKIPEDTESEQTATAMGVPAIIEDDKEVFEIEDSIYDMDGINFDEIHCDFKKEITQGLASNIAQMLLSKPKSITVVKGKREYFPRTYELIDKIRQNKIFDNIAKVTCTADLKYKPYGFFNELLTGLYGFSVTGKSKEYNNFQNILPFDQKGYVQKIVNLKPVESAHPEEVRQDLFTSFEQILASKQKLLVIVENIEKIDDSSFELLRKMMKNLEKNNISYIIFSDKDYCLHKDAHFLLAKREYTEITLKPTPIKTLVEANSKLCKNILNTFYLQKISKNTKGSQMYFMQALLHLIDLGIFSVEDGSLVQTKSETTLFPTTLDELIQRRLNLVKQTDEKLFKLLACILLIGPQIDLQTIKYFNNENIDDYLKFLDSKGLIYSANGVIQVQNYELYLDNILKLMTAEEVRAIANFLIIYFFKESDAHPVLAKLYSIVNSGKNEFVQWENLSDINRSLGDFSAYFMCGKRFLKLLKSNVSDTTTKSFEEYQTEIYENIASLLYKYTPEKIADITTSILENFQLNAADKRGFNLCNKILQGCLISGSCSQGLLMAHKILAGMEKNSPDPKSQQFDIHALIISLQKVELLFNIGDLENCIELGEELFKNLLGMNIEQIKPKTLSLKNFTDLLTDSAGYVIFAKILQLKSDVSKFCELAEAVLKSLPEGYRVFLELDALLHGKQINLTNISEKELSNKFSASLYKILSAFSKYGKEDNENFAEEIYRAKLNAKEYNMYQMELFCDLMIGQSYTKLEKFKKASTIINSVMETSQNLGMTNLYYLSVYYTADLYRKDKHLDTAYGLIANTIITLEQNTNTNPYILMMFKELYANVLKMKNENEQATLCHNQAVQIAQAHNIRLK